MSTIRSLLLFSFAAVLVASILVPVKLSSWQRETLRKETPRMHRAHEEAGIVAAYAAHWLQTHGGPQAFDALEMSVLVKDAGLAMPPELSVDPWGSPWRLEKHAYPTFATGPIDN
jgi:hypothetical protein